MSIAQVFPIENPAYINTPGFLAGVECEVESVRAADGCGDSFMITQDGSLRNNGHEFISKPLGFPSLITAFERLHRDMTYYNKDDAFSERTSTHVHVNCQNCTIEQVRQIVLMYALFEELFYVAVKPERRHNIHCVALTETFLPNYYNYNLPNMVAKWSKYTGLNLLPLKTLGTIEFRHLHGTGDFREFRDWLTVLKNLWELGRTCPMNEKNMNDTTTLLSWFDTIFGTHPRIMPLRHAVLEIIKNSIIDVKFAFIK